MAVVYLSLTNRVGFVIANAMTQTGSPQTLEDVGPVFGGMHVDLNVSGNATSTLSDLPAIVEGALQRGAQIAYR